jgi:2-methylcitrate dehydratase PrpD
MTARGASRDWVGALAASAATTDIDEVPAVVRERLRLVVIDCLALAAFGSRRPELHRLADVVGTPSPLGASTVLGHGVGRSSGVAAFLNAAAMAADQYQDGHRPARGHPASHVVPAVFALAEESDASNRTALSSVLAGYEVGTKVGMAMNGTPAGIHDIGTWGEIAVAAAVAHLVMPRDPDAVRRAIELAASAVLITDASTIFSGHTGGHTYLAASTTTGMLLGQAAAAGLEAKDDAVDRHFARVAAADWAPSPPSEDVTAGPTHEVMNGYIKLHPTCAHLHGVNDAVEDILMELRARQGASTSVGNRVVRVVVETYAQASTFDSVADSELAARFSIPTVVAVALLDGALDAARMTDDLVQSEAVTDLARRVRVVHRRELDAGYPAGRPARATVELDDGSVLQASSARPRGDSDHPGSVGPIEDKAARLLRARFGPARKDCSRPCPAGRAPGRRASWERLSPRIRHGGWPVIVTRKDGTLTLVSQVEHGRVAGALARSWGNDVFDRPQPYESVSMAAAKHDEGWRAWDDRVLVNELARRPLHFLEIDTDEHVRLYRHGVETVSLGDVYAGVLVGMHWTGLYRGRWSSPSARGRLRQGPQVGASLDDVVHAEEHRWVAAKRRAWTVDEPRADFEARLWHNFELLQFWDLLSLYLCVTPEEPQAEALPAATWGSQLASLEHDARPVILPPIRIGPWGQRSTLVVRVVARATMCVDPWPFRTTEVTVEVEGTVIPDHQYDADASRRLVRATPPSSRTWTLRPPPADATRDRPR